MVEGEEGRTGCRREDGGLGKRRATSTKALRLAWLVLKVWGREGGRKGRGKEVRWTWTDRKRRGAESAPAVSACRLTCSLAGLSFPLTYLLYSLSGKQACTFTSMLLVMVSVMWLLLPSSSCPLHLSYPDAAHSPPLKGIHACTTHCIQGAKRPQAKEGGATPLGAAAARGRHGEESCLSWCSSAARPCLPHLYFSRPGKYACIYACE